MRFPFSDFINRNGDCHWRLKMASFSKQGQRLLVDGYIRNNTKLWKMNIPSDISEVIFLFYQVMIVSDILTIDESKILYDMIMSHFECKMINFDLIYRGTRDGFGVTDFSERCHDIKEVMVICETTKDIVCGGYTSVGFNKSLGNYKDENAFLYSIRTNNEKYPPKIFPILKGKEKLAMCQWKGYLFGFANSGIWLQVNCNKPGTNSGIAGLSYLPNEDANYLKAGATEIGRVQMKELEVFQLSLQ